MWGKREVGMWVLKSFVLCISAEQEAPIRQRIGVDTFPQRGKDSYPIWFEAGVN